MRYGLLICSLFAFSLLVPVCGAAQPQQAKSERKKAEDEDYTFKRTFDARTEPNIPEVKYLALEPPKTLRERIERLTYGITVDIPPEYDQYGYEIRRFMTGLINQAIFTDRKRLESELRNVRNAGIVLKYWREALENEVNDLRAALDEQQADSASYTAFNHNSSVVQIFLPEIGAWLATNEALLNFMMEQNAAEYSFENGEISFIDPDDARYFAKYLRAREDARKVMVEKYYPFRIMPY